MERLEDRTLLSSISGSVYADGDGDGQQDANELGLDGVTVYVDVNRNGVNDAGEPVAMSTADGSYLFENLTSNDDTYVIRTLSPAGYQAISPQGATEFFYGIDFSRDELVRIDARSGVVASVGPYGNSSSISAVVATHSGEVFGLSSAVGALWRIDPDTGLAAFVGNAGRPVRAVLAYDPVADVIYGLGELDNGLTGLVKYDRTSGLALPIQGNANLDGAFSDGTWDPIGRRVVVFDNRNDQFWALAPATGDATLLSTPSFAIDSYSLAYDSARGFLIHINGTNQLYRVDLATGQLTPDFVFSQTINLDALDSGGPHFAHIVTLKTDVSKDGLDFGFQALPPGEINGAVFLDLDGDGRRGIGENGLAGVTVYLDLNGNDVADSEEPTTVSDTDGAYRFSNVAAGTYLVRQVLPSGFHETRTGSGQGTYYSIDIQNLQLMRIEEATGAATAVPLQPPPGYAVPSLFGLAYANDGNLYALQGNLSNDVLWKLDPGTGVLTRIGATGHQLGWGLAYDPETDTLYALTYLNGYTRLGTINRFTGAFAVIPSGNGVPNVSNTPDALANVSGLVFDPAQQRIIAYDFRDGEIYSFSRDGTALRISRTTPQLTGGFTYNGDSFVMQRRTDSALIAIDPDRGSWTVLNDIVPDYFDEALEYVRGSDSSHLVSVVAGQTVSDRNFGSLPGAGTIQGAIWHDIDLDGIRDVDETSLSGQTVYLDLNGNGVFDDGTPKTITVDPDAFAQGAVLTDAVPGVSLTALSNGQPFDSVKSYGSWFGHRLRYGAEAVFWGGSFPTLRADFDDPADSVDVDFQPYVGGAQAWLRAFDAAGNLLAEVISDPLTKGVTSRISIAASGIAYVLATGRGESSPYVLIGRLSFTTALEEPAVVTGADGDYVFTDVAAGTYFVRPMLPTTDWVQTSRGNDDTLYYGIGYPHVTTAETQLLTIDPATGEVTWIGSPLPVRLHGLVRTNSGELFGTSYVDDSLYQIDPATGAMSLIGSTGMQIVAGLAYDPETDTIYSLGKPFENDTVNRLLIVNPRSGQVTPIGPGTTGLPSTSGLAFDAANRRVLAFDYSDGEFYAFDLQGNATLLSTGPNVRTWAFSQGPDGFVLQPFGSGNQYLAPIDPESASLGPLFELSQTVRLEALDWNYDASRWTVQVVGGAVENVNFGLADPTPKVTGIRIGYGDAVDTRWADASDLVDRTAPWKVNKFEYTFDRDVAVEIDDLVVMGVLGGIYAYSDFTYDPANRRAVWTMATAIDRDRLLITLDGDDAASDANDGVSSQGVFLSGGDSVTALDVLFGDVNGDGQASLLDALIQRSRNTTSDAWADLDGSGTVSLRDALLLRSRNGTVLAGSSPIADSAELTTSEDTALSGRLTGRDPDGDQVTFHLASLPEHGELTFDSDGAFVYTPQANTHGPDGFMFRTFDGFTYSAPATVSINVQSVNDTPVVAAFSRSTSEDTPLSGRLTGQDLDGDALSFEAVSGPQSGTLTLDADGDYVYTPDANFFGTDAFSFRAFDGTSFSNVVTVSITVTSVNDAPMLADREFTSPEDALLYIYHSQKDVDGDTLTYSIVTGPSHGTLSLYSGTTYLYRPDNDYFGADSFTIRAFDGLAYSRIATVLIDVTPVNDVPRPDHENFRIPEDGSLTTQLTASDPDGDPITFEIFLGNAYKWADVSLTPDGLLTIVPLPNFTGDFYLDITAYDGIARSGPVPFHIVVDPVRDDPVAVADSYVTSEDAPLSITATYGISFSGEMTSEAGDPIGGGQTYSVSIPPSSIKVIRDGPGGYIGLRIPDSNGPWSWTFDFYAPDGQSLQAGTYAGAVRRSRDTAHLPGMWISGSDIGEDVNFTGEFTIHKLVWAPDYSLTELLIDFEQFAAGSSAAFRGTLHYFNLRGNPGLLGNDYDVDGEALKVSSYTPPTHGTVTPLQDGSFYYQPDENFSGIDSFTYRASDGTRSSAPVTVTILVTPVDDAPLAADMAVAGNEDQTTSGQLAGTDPDGDPLSYAIGTLPLHGAVAFDESTGQFTYTPDPDWSGTDSFTYTARDHTTESQSATVTVTVAAANDPPVADDATFAVVEHSPVGTVVGSVVANDIDGDTLAYRIAAGDSAGNFAIDSSGQIVVAKTGLDRQTTPQFVLTVEVDDGNGAVATAAITIEVTTLPTRIDVAPDSTTNVIELKSNKTLDVALFGSRSGEVDFDVRNVDLSSLRLQIGAMLLLPATTGNGSYHVTYTDLDGDGVEDLVIRFDLTSATATSGEVPATLSGELLTGTDFTGIDAVTLT